MMSSIMLIDFTGSTATRTNEIGQATDGGDIRATVRAKLEFVAKESPIVHRVPAIRACEYCSPHFFFDKAHDAGIRLDFDEVTSSLSHPPTAVTVEHDNIGGRAIREVLLASDSHR